MIVTKIGGAVCKDRAVIQEIANAWNTRDRQEPWCIVHGGGPQLTTALADLGEEPRRIDGLRVTTRQAAQVVAEVLDDVGADLTSRLQAAGVPAVHVPATTGAIHAVTKDEPAGLERVGTFTSFDATVLPHAPDDEDAPDAVYVVTPVGWDANGPLNINADEAATGIASAIKARCLHLVTDVPGYMDAQSQVVPAMTPRTVDDAVVSGVAKGGMAVKLRNACAALSYGLPQVRIGDIQSLADTHAGTRIIPSPSKAVEVVPRRK